MRTIFISGERGSGIGDRGSGIGDPGVGKKCRTGDRETVQKRQRATPHFRRRARREVRTRIAGPVEMSIRSFRDLEAWQLGIELALRVYSLTKSFPREE